MKLSKILMASAVLAAAVGFMACTEEDDQYNLITEENSDLYTIDATNDTAGAELKIIRGYRSTNFKHAGALVKVSFSKKAASPNGVMGVIFGLHEGVNGKDFGIIGLRDNGSYYVSGLRNVQDLQASNFGATANEANYKNAEYADPVEYEAVALGATYTGKTTEDGYSVYVYYRDTVVSEGKHAYQVFILNDATDEWTADDTGKVFKDAAKTQEADLGTPVATIPYDDASKDVVQYKFAPYANVYPVEANKTAESDKNVKSFGTGSMKGSWKVQGTYKEAGVEAN